MQNFTRILRRCKMTVVCFIIMFVLKSGKMKHQIFKILKYCFKYIARSFKFQLNHVFGVTIVAHLPCRGTCAVGANFEGKFLQCFIPFMP